MSNLLLNWFFCRFSFLVYLFFKLFTNIPRTRRKNWFPTEPRNNLVPAGHPKFSTYPEKKLLIPENNIFLYFYLWCIEVFHNKDWVDSYLLTSCDDHNTFLPPPVTCTHWTQDRTPHSKKFYPKTLWRPGEVFLGR